MMRRAALPTFGLLVLLLGGCDDREPVRATLSVAETLAEADTAGFARAVEPRPFAFPADHGAHPDYRHEWWYFTGNLEPSRAGAAAPAATPPRDPAFGFQLTFFRSALRPDATALRSAWATRQAYMGHFALTVVAEGAFHAFERFDRGALGLAGATPAAEAAAGAAVRVWVGPWEARLLPDTAARGVGAWRVRAAEDGVAIDLVLTPEKPVVLQGDRGLSRKGAERGNASYYYSLTRLEAEGTVRVEGRPIPVRGTAWLDREWGTSALASGLAGWDWFSLQLAGGQELMLYRLRREDGGTDPFSAGTWVDADGAVTRLGPDDFVLDDVGTWKSPTGVVYPSGWRLRVPAAGLDLGIEPRVRGQELDLAFRYWEGAVGVTGTRGGAPVRGVGYVELTGYDAGG